MSTLNEMRSALEQLERDARRFRYLSTHTEAALEIIERAQENAESSLDVPALIRGYTDKFLASPEVGYTEGEDTTP